MSFQIRLNINDKENLFVRNGDPNLRDMTNALKVQSQQVKMYSKTDGPDESDFDKNESNLANFAVGFWQNQFSKNDVIEGATYRLKTIESINDAIEATLGAGEDPEDGKKSSRRVLKKQLGTSTLSTKTNLKKDISSPKSTK